MEEQSRNNSAAFGQGPGSSWGNIYSNIFEFFWKTKAPTQVEDGNFRLRARFLEHCPVTSPPTNQNKATHPAALTPNFTYKNFSPQTIGKFGVFEHESPILFAWPYNKPFSAPKFWCFSLFGLTVYQAHELFSITVIPPIFTALSEALIILDKALFFAPKKLPGESNFFFLHCNCW